MFPRGTERDQWPEMGYFLASFARQNLLLKESQTFGLGIYFKRNLLKIFL